MNSDDLMSDPAHPANHPADPKTAGAWNTKKFRDEYEMYKNRLQDKGFTVGMQRLSSRPLQPAIQ